MSRKIIIAGSRGIPSSYITSNLERMRFEADVIVSGCAQGADRGGIDYALLNNIPVKKFPYPSDMGRAGGPYRNAQMAEYADAAIVF